MRNPSHFQRGSGAYGCRCCHRVTRSTGRGDNENVQLCAECFDLAGEENHLTDNGEFYSSPAEVLRLVTEVARKGGDASCWGEIKTRAEAEIQA